MEVVGAKGSSSSSSSSSDTALAEGGTMLASSRPSLEPRVVKAVDVPAKEAAPEGRAELNELSLRELRQLAKARLGPNVISLAVGGASGRTKRDIVEDLLMALREGRGKPQ